MTHATIKKWGVRFFLLAVCLVVVFSWHVGSKLTAPATCDVVLDTQTRASFGASFHKFLVQKVLVQELRIPTTNGSECAAWYASHSAADATIILAHPIRANRRAMLRRAGYFFRQGYSVLLIDLPAHGESDGEHITFGFRERHGVLAAVKFVREQTPNQKVAVVGWSLGGAAALLASPLPIDALVLESVYPTVSGATHNRVKQRLGGAANILSPLLLAQLPIRLGIWPSDLRPIDSLQHVRCPVMILAGEDDHHTTLSESKAMFAAANQPKEFVMFPGATHVDLYAHDHRMYEDRVGAFLAESLSK